MQNNGPLILLVDDDPSSLTLMSEILHEAGYQIAAANSGETCFMVLNSLNPDLILCDIVMPGLDGYDVCRRIKSDVNTADIPLIFLTSLKTSEEMLTGFEAGAVDFLTKPVNGAELLARVKTHSELKQSRDNLRSYSHQLAELNAKKDQILGIVAHDLRNPIGAIYTAERVLRSYSSHQEDAVIKMYDIIEKACRSADDLIAELLEMAELDQRQGELNFESVSSAAFLTSIYEFFQDRAKAKNVNLNLILPSQDVEINIHSKKLSRAFGNLVHNALKFTPKDGLVTLKLHIKSESCVFSVIDTGIGIPENLQQHIFDKFTNARREGLGGEQAHGLGMHITREIIRRHGGRIDLYSEPGTGTEFRIQLPLTP